MCGLNAPHINRRGDFGEGEKRRERKVRREKKSLSGEECAAQKEYISRRSSQIARALLQLRAALRSTIPAPARRTLRVADWARERARSREQHRESKGKGESKPPCRTFVVWINVRSEFLPPLHGHSPTLFGFAFLFSSRNLLFAFCKLRRLRI